MSIVKLNNRGVRSVTAFGSLTSGSITFIKKLTASSSSTLSFVDGSSDVVLDNTYKEYIFHFVNMHPASDSQSFQFNMSVDSGSNYNVTKTTTDFLAYNYEGSENPAALGYNSGLAQSTNFQDISSVCGNDNDQSTSGFLHLFNPSSTTFVKHFISKAFSSNHDNSAVNFFAAGYGNTTSAVDAIQFKFSSGNIDSGQILLFGLN